MNEYIYTKLAAERAAKLRAEADAFRFARLFSRRRSQRQPKIPHQTRRSLRAAH